MPRFFVDTKLEDGQTIALSDANAHHALRVLRLAVGDELTLFNGRGGEHVATIAQAGKSGVSVSVGPHVAREAELPFDLTLAQGLSGADRMDWTIEKAVELGAAHIQPLAMERSVTRLSSERAQRRHLHWLELITAATQQCGRNRICALAALSTLHDWLPISDASATRLMLDPEGGPLREHIADLKPGGRVVLLAGPEAGLSPEERNAARAAGFAAVSLGPRVLRTETAGAAAIAMLTTLIN